MRSKTRGEGNGKQILSQTETSRTVKQQQIQISRNHVPTIILLPVSSVFFCTSTQLFLPNPSPEYELKIGLMGPSRLLAHMHSNDLIKIQSLVFYPAHIWSFAYMILKSHDV